MTPHAEQQGAFDLLAQAHHCDLGVTWHMNASFKPNHWVFCGFCNVRGPKGQGRVALQEVVALADRLDVTIILQTMVPKLFAYYESFGFVRDPAGQLHERLTDIISFKREPHADPKLLCGRRHHGNPGTGVHSPGP